LLRAYSTAHRDGGAAGADTQTCIQRLDRSRVSSKFKPLLGQRSPDRAPIVVKLPEINIPLPQSLVRLT